MKRFTIYDLRCTICLLLGCIVFTSCRSDIVYSQFVAMPDQWHADSMAQFDYSIADTSVDYQILVYVRHTERYPYQNMWLFLSDGTMKDTIEFYLADDRGQWLGNRHHGFIEMPVLIEDNYPYPDTGVYHLVIQHAMRDSLLRGVTDIGMEVIKN